MNKCIICGNDLSLIHKHSKYKRKTCSEECLRKYLSNTVSNSFLKNSYKKGDTPFNKGLAQDKWMSKTGRSICSKTHIQYQENCKSPLSIIEGRYLPHNTNVKGTIIKRSHVHRTGKNVGKVETEVFINIDWQGNRKPNNLYKKYIWEVYNQQPLPNGYVVAFKDSNIDKTNIDNYKIDNLELITRKELLKRNRYKEI